MEGIFNSKNNCTFIILRKSWYIATSVSSRITPTTEKSIDQKETENLFISEHGRERREGGRGSIRRSRRTIRPFTRRPKYKDAYCT